MGDKGGSQLAEVVKKSYSLKQIRCEVVSLVCIMYFIYGQSFTDVMLIAMYEICDYN